MAFARFLIPLVLGLLFLVPVTFSSCSSGKKTCREKTFHKTYNTRKNKSKYNQKYSVKSKSVKKDYRIRNGIAN
jgi:uncharacterized lipoprotein